MPPSFPADERIERGAFETHDASVLIEQPEQEEKTDVEEKSVEAEKESPQEALEEKPQDRGTVPAHVGWLPIDLAPLTGIQVYVSSGDEDKKAARAFWKRTRRYEQGRWRLNGKWIDAVTGSELDFAPLYWREA